MTLKANRKKKKNNKVKTKFFIKSTTIMSTGHGGIHLGSQHWESKGSL